jgi:hypothetical protein
MNKYFYYPYLALILTREGDAENGACIIDQWIAELKGWGFNE